MKIILTRGPFDVTATIPGTQVSVTGRNEEAVFAELLSKHAVALGIEIEHADPPTATPEHLAAVLRGEDRGAVFGPVTLRALFQALPSTTIFRDRVHGEAHTAAEWVTTIRDMDADEPSFLRRQSSRGPRTLEISMMKSLVYSEVASAATPGWGSR